MTLAMSELLRVETPYEQFSKKFKEVVNSDIFTNDKVKIFRSKSFINKIKLYKHITIYII